MKKSFAKIACGFAAASLALALVACDDSSSSNNVSGPDNEEISSESNGGDEPEVSSDSGNGSENVESSDTAKSSGSVESSASTDNSSASLDDNSSSSMAITCQALTLECYSAQQLCNKGLTEYCVNSSSSTETCQHVSDVDGGSCRDGEVVKDCATDKDAVCFNNTWVLAVIGDDCQTSGREIVVSSMVLKCEDGYWKYSSIIDNCPPGNSCQPPNYGCLTHPINDFSCNEGNNKVYQLTVTTRGAGDCMYQCYNGKYSVVMTPAPVGN